MIVLGLDWAYSSQGPNQTKGPKQSIRSRGRFFKSPRRASYTEWYKYGIACLVKERGIQADTQRQRDAPQRSQAPHLVPSSSSNQLFLVNKLLSSSWTTSDQLVFVNKLINSSCTTSNQLVFILGSSSSQPILGHEAHLREPGSSTSNQLVLILDRPARNPSLDAKNTFRCQDHLKELSSSLYVKAVLGHQDRLSGHYPVLHQLSARSFSIHTR
ncbi:hypothetical protein AtNW77_Chr4g0281511 [Arabidopsis thaliana]|uniref:Uncharacterized protein AT4g08740 n=3 Tax=Arabidopsis TaxID=3701 RepID=Q9LE68_ARATH|nr:uncharacterized protein AT4G08740 [Arabidopsis thaliana]KAG7615326.1 hypothetical protein ISN45_At04g008760 [Arabidopsis thaliana x Arabidopsis arenosa]AEE82674.1 hypothetical protein AT4G08740 [Arabidopsis thaliana]OAO98813.1 hypothetical protein AXX17_AT4G09930 [Arabidopsis thaliana]CAB77999.1 hypothetical protein [Arabidopsis thaliana]CAB82110.1 hypothetical protein [Arabidopsis thaliana]|eukprot:NP_192614.1 hypothetical protein AT4G08740 [Arabidopsis thaliana]